MKGLPSLYATDIACALQAVASGMSDAHFALVHSCRGETVNTRAKQQWDMETRVMPDKITKCVCVFQPHTTKHPNEQSMHRSTEEWTSTYLKYISLASWQMILASGKALPVWTPPSHFCTVNLIPCKQHTPSIPIGGCMAANLHGIWHTGVCRDEMTTQMLSMVCLVMQTFGEKHIEVPS